jgi:DNA helicase II / ATP-dependent DNA helicase PcrA
MKPEPELSPEQAEVVEFKPDAGHLLVIARPGSGKTHTLAARARRLIQDGIPANRMLAMTFSTRAADELKDRLPGSEVWAGTFHAICADILERHGSVIGVEWLFRIADEARTREILLRAISDVDFSLPRDERARRRWLDQLTSRIESRKRQGRDHIESMDRDYIPPDVVAHIDQNYCRCLTEANTLDFADLIAKAVEVLEEDELTAEELRARVSHLLVDEFHDVSPEQYQLMVLLAPPHSKSQVFVVADPDQAIYTW